MKDNDQRLKLVGFIYVPVIRGKGISNRSVLLMYQLKCQDDVSAWSRTFKMVTKMGKFLLGTRQCVFSAFQVVQSLKVPAIVHRYNV